VQNIMIDRVTILGGGSAGFMAALALKAKVPAVQVELVRSPGIGIIGVGEGSTPGVSNFFHRTLGIPFDRFFNAVNPTWKLGLQFLWGPRKRFFYTFDPPFEQIVPGLPKAVGFYCQETSDFASRYDALMAHDRIFERGPNGELLVHQRLANHFENERLVEFLEAQAASVGISIRDDTVEGVQQVERGITGLMLSSGQVAKADLYVDCSGFPSVLLNKTLGEPFVSYKSSLFCDRAVVGGWARTSEPIHPYTTCETMDSGWCWQIEHEGRINCGYVYSSSFITEEEAEAEFRRQRPKVGPTRIVKFTSGRYQRGWVKNVVAIGNAGGFVEPLEATALGVIGVQSALLATTLLDGDRQVRPSQMDRYNAHHADQWDSIRDFLAVHYKFNTRRSTPFWEHCRRETCLGGAEHIVEFYRENGPSVLWGSTLLSPHNAFGMRGYYALLLGQEVPFHRTYVPSPADLARWEAFRESHRQAALRAATVKEAMEIIRSPDWKVVKAQG
jgi:tryptophan halogenase